MSDVDQENVSDCLSLVSSLFRPIIMLAPRCEILPNQPIRAERGVNNDTLDQSQQSSISVKAIIIKQFSSCWHVLFCHFGKVNVSSAFQYMQ